MAPSLRVTLHDTRSRSKHENRSSVHKWGFLSTGPHALSTPNQSPDAPPNPLATDVFSDRAGHRLTWGLAPNAPSGTLSRVRVKDLPEGPDIAAEVVVLGHLPLDLFAALYQRRLA